MLLFAEIQGFDWLLFDIPLLEKFAEFFGDRRLTFQFIRRAGFLVLRG